MMLKEYVVLDYRGFLVLSLRVLIFFSLYRGSWKGFEEEMISFFG